MAATTKRPTHWSAKTRAELLEIFLKAAIKNCVVLGADQDIQDAHDYLLSYRYLYKKLRTLGIQPLIEDLDLASGIQQMPEDNLCRLQTLGTTLRQVSHTLTRDPQQLVVQLHRRFAGSANENIRQLLASARQLTEHPWLKCVRSSWRAQWDRLFVSVAEVNALVIDWDRKQLVTGEGNEIRMRDLETGETLDVHTGHASWVSCLALTTDGRMVSGSWDRTLRVWDLDTGATLATHAGNRNAVVCVAVTSDGRAISACDQNLRVWDLQTGELQATLAGHRRAVRHVTVTADNRAVSISDDQELLLWNLTTYRAESVPPAQRDEIFSIADTPDGPVYEAALSQDGSVWMCLLATGEIEQTFTGHESDVNCVAVTPDGRVVSGSDDKTIRVWPLNPRKSRLHRLQRKGHTSRVTCLAMTSDGRAVTGSSDKTLKVWDLHTGEIAQTLTGHKEKVTCVAVTPNGQVVSGSWDNTLRVWDIETGETQHIITGHSHGIHCVALTTDGRAVSGDGYWFLGISDLSTGEIRGYQRCDGPYEDWRSRHRMLVQLIPVSDGRLVSRAGDASLLVWDMETGASKPLMGPSWGYSDTLLTVTPSGRIVSGTEEGNMWIWDPQTGKSQELLNGHRGRCAFVAPTPDGGVVSGSSDGTLRLWNLETGESEQLVHEFWYSRIAVTPNGRSVCASKERTIAVWSMISGQEIAHIELEAKISAMGISPEAIIVAADVHGLLYVLQLNSVAS